MTLPLPDRRRLLVLTGAAGLALILPRGAHSQTLTPEAVLHDPDAPVLGNPAGDVTVVEYFDYQCPFCKSMHPVLSDVVARDGQVRLVLKDWPIFGPASRQASELVLGAHGLGLYEPALEALMATEGRLTEAEIAETLAPVVPVAAARAAWQDAQPRWEALLQRNAAQARALGFQGTPGLAVETTLFAGAVDGPSLERAIEAARAA